MRYKGEPNGTGGFIYKEVGSKPSDVQVGGGHYKDMPIQPIEFIYKNGLDVFQGKVIKYVVRHKQKAKAEDLRKAIHMLEMYLEFEYGES